MFLYLSKLYQHHSQPSKDKVVLHNFCIKSNSDIIFKFYLTYFFFSNDEIFYLFRLSYMWLGVLGLIVCLTVGIIISLVASKILKIHPADLADHLDPNLFVPPVAKYLTNKRHQRLRLCSLGNKGSAKARE